ncbi:hypothetical protein ONZ45_g9215 [Pleurotus djamor]|nr:hypothetical protein ONZ45_g9215 [Pleurotus djamor]
MASNVSKQIVIIGGGIIGCTTAYYITKLDAPNGTSSTGSTVTVIEASKNGVAQGASGKAGGLVAKWAYPKSLAGTSFEEHEALAEAHDGGNRWGFRYVECGTWVGKADPVSDDPDAGSEGPMKVRVKKTAELDTALQAVFSKTRAQKGLPEGLNWVKEENTGRYSPMAERGETAQVHPYLFTTSMMDLAAERGAKLIAGRATSINQSEKQVTGVTYIDNVTQESITIPATHVVVCAGPWSASLVPKLPMSATRVHSIVIHPKPEAEISPYVLFADVMLPSGESVTPEIYARPNNEVYACGPGDDEPLPATVDEVEVHAPACDSLWARVAGISNELREGRLDTKQSCYLPHIDTSTGPVVGQMKKLKGLLVATGHSCWVRESSARPWVVANTEVNDAQGICNAPGTAKAIAESIAESYTWGYTDSSLTPAQVVPGIESSDEEDDD